MNVPGQVGFGWPIETKTMWCSISRWIGTGLPSGLMTFTLMPVMNPSTFGRLTRSSVCRTSYGFIDTSTV